MKVKGIVVEGKNGELYVLGIGERATGAQRERPTIWRMQGATFESLEQSKTASATIRDRLELKAPLVAGLTHDEHVKWTVLESLTWFIGTFFRDVRW